MLNSPGNPSGAVLSADELKALAEVLRRHPQVWILSDDIYEYLVYDGMKFQNMLNVAPDLADRFLLVHGLSKAYSMTGWRVGYAAGPEQLIKAMFKIQSQSTSGANHISQWASVSALTGDHSFVSAESCRVHGAQEPGCQHGESDQWVQLFATSRGLLCFYLLQLLHGQEDTERKDRHKR